MNVNNFLSPRLMIGAAIVGIVGAAGVFIYEQVYAEKRRAMLVNEVARLDKQVANVRSELESLRQMQNILYLENKKHKKAVKARRKKDAIEAFMPSGDTSNGPDQSYASDSDCFTDYQSVLGTDGEMDSEEFYDVPTDDDVDDTLRITDGRVFNPKEQKTVKDEDCLSSNSST